MADPEAETPIAVVEAGTGTGKTIAYLVAALPIARAEAKSWWSPLRPWHCRNSCYSAICRMSCSTAASIRCCAGQGRGRYVCLLKLDHQLSDHGADPLIPLYPDEFFGAEEELAGPTLEEMIQALGDASWDGDLDAWPEQLSPVYADSLPRIKASARAGDALILPSAAFFAPAKGSTRPT